MDLQTGQIRGESTLDWLWKNQIISDPPGPTWCNQILATLRCRRGAFNGWSFY